MISILDTSSKKARRIFYTSSDWRMMRAYILERDNYECQWCKRDGKVTSQLDSVLEVDHIKELKDYPELALDESNLRTLCKDCHNKRHERFNYREKKKNIKWNDEFW